MTKEHKDLIDQWLKYLNGLNSEFHLKMEYCKLNNLAFEQSPPGFATVRALLENFELVKANAKGTFDTGSVLTPFGKEMADAGGWDLFFKMEQRFRREFEHDKQMMEAVNQSTLHQHQLAAEMHKFQKRATTMGLLLTALVGFATIAQVVIAYKGKSAQTQVQDQSQQLMDKERP